MSETEPTTAKDIYERLKAPFDDLKYRDIGGGDQAAYITGEQAITRLNDEAGTNNWDWEILHEEVDLQNYQVWIKGLLTVRFPDGTKTRKTQFGSSEIRRHNDIANAEQYSRFPDWKKAQFTRLDNGSYRGPKHGQIIDLGFDLKSASTDATKKAATLVGVGLWLTAKNGNGNNQQRSAPPRPQNQPSQNAQHTAQNQSGELINCSDCGEPLEVVEFRDNTSWSIDKLANFGRSKHGRVLDWNCYRKAKAAKEREQQEVAF